MVILNHERDGITGDLDVTIINPSMQAEFAGSIDDGIPVTISNPTQYPRTGSWVTIAVPDVNIPTTAKLTPQNWPVYIGQSISKNTRLVHIQCGRIEAFEQVWGWIVETTPSLYAVMIGIVMEVQNASLNVSLPHQHADPTQQDIIYAVQDGKVFTVLNHAHADPGQQDVIYTVQNGSLVIGDGLYATPAEITVSALDAKPLGIGLYQARDGIQDSDLSITVVNASTIASNILYSDLISLSYSILDATSVATLNAATIDLTPSVVGGAYTIGTMYADRVDITTSTLDAALIYEEVRHAEIASITYTFPEANLSAVNVFEANVIDSVTFSALDQRLNVSSEANTINSYFVALNADVSAANAIYAETIIISVEAALNSELVTGHELAASTVETTFSAINQPMDVTAIMTGTPAFSTFVVLNPVVTNVGGRFPGPVSPSRDRVQRHSTITGLRATVTESTTIRLPTSPTTPIYPRITIRETVRER